MYGVRLKHRHSCRYLAFARESAAQIAFVHPDTRVIAPLCVTYRWSDLRVFSQHVPSESGARVRCTTFNNLQCHPVHPDCLCLFPYSGCPRPRYRPRAYPYAYPSAAFPPRTLTLLPRPITAATATSSFPARLLSFDISPPRPPPRAPACLLGVHPPTLSLRATLTISVTVSRIHAHSSSARVKIDYVPLAAAGVGPFDGGQRSTSASCMPLRRSSRVAHAHALRDDMCIRRAPTPTHLQFLRFPRRFFASTDPMYWCGCGRGCGWSCTLLVSSRRDEVEAEGGGMYAPHQRPLHPESYPFCTGREGAGTGSRRWSARGRRGLGVRATIVFAATDIYLDRVHSGLGIQDPRASGTIYRMIRYDTIRSVSTPAFSPLLSLLERTAASCFSFLLSVYLLPSTFHLLFPAFSYLPPPFVYLLHATFYLLFPRLQLRSSLLPSPSLPSTLRVPSPTAIHLRPFATESATDRHRVLRPFSRFPAFPTDRISARPRDTRRRSSDAVDLRRTGSFPRSRSCFLLPDISPPASAIDRATAFPTEPSRHREMVYLHDVARAARWTNGRTGPFPFLLAYLLLASMPDISHPASAIYPAIDPATDSATDPAIDPSIDPAPPRDAR
ncbi:hypothetical protein DFH06DRAFT_1317167 [Mycena polygramma]|nr:hypothetical protein DFH06DRAFT_1317167 [Mycena polygramma]